ETFAPVTNAKALNAVSMLTVAGLCLPWALAQAAIATSVPEALSEVGHRSAALVQEHPMALLYLGVLTTAFTSWLQTIGQQSVAATTASVIYALDPLWGCFFAYLWLGEELGPQGILGCAVLFGVWFYQLASAKGDSDQLKLAEQVPEQGAE
ncbi:unnamed protein product, partial [Polarella glacialis]